MVCGQELSVYRTSAWDVLFQLAAGDEAVESPRAVAPIVRDYW